MFSDSILKNPGLGKRITGSSAINPSTVQRAATIDLKPDHQAHKQGKIASIAFHLLARGR
jgi:hypothetical protein